ncbi:MAG: ribosome small subunit-dependent GTPase A [Clostridia bacterium]|nr:ribosome small subunit-dependent GTPase A [Clostridia bacterium]
MNGIIIKALSGFYYVSCDGQTYECKARGSFRKSGVSPLVGDRVEFEITDDDKGVVNEILPRKNCISRPPVANIDKLFIISAFASPAPNTLLIDKMTVIAEHNGIEPIIVFNKCDMGSFAEWECIYKKSGFRVYTVSADSGEGIEALEAELENSVSAFTGNSGVGKSSLLNRLFGSDIILTGEVSEKLGRGRHTTRHTEIYRLPCGGFVADTPGFSSLELETDDYTVKENLPFYFREFSEISDNCRFSTCTHTGEKGCAVTEAVASGKIAESRHSSYCELFAQMKDLKPWEGKKRKNR